MIDLKKLRELAEAATQGEWCVVDGNGWLNYSIRKTGDQKKSFSGCTLSKVEKGGNGGSNANYIAAANPTTILALLDRLEAEERDAERYRFIRSVDQNKLFTVNTNERINMPFPEELDAAIDVAMKDGE